MKEAVLITGASSGIGRELAKLFAKDSYDLILVARSQDELEALARELKSTYDIFVKVIAIDLSESTSPKKIFQVTEAANLKVSVLINNAGFGTYGEFVTLPIDTELDEIQVNITSLTHLTGLFLPSMVKSKKGKVLNVSSTGAFAPGPLMASYFASKAYVLHFSEALSEELRGSGVTVSVLCPGPSRTGFIKRAHVESVPFFQKRLMTSEKVARIAYQGLFLEKEIIIPGFINRLEVFLTRFMPRSFMRKAVKRGMGVGSK